MELQPAEAGRNIACGSVAGMAGKYIEYPLTLSNFGCNPRQLLSRARSRSTLALLNAFVNQSSGTDLPDYTVALVYRYPAQHWRQAAYFSSRGSGGKHSTGLDGIPATMGLYRFQLYGTAKLSSHSLLII
ncbi:hypothetical protein LSUB1_G002377 [Lachnellula subtilissima]|uniref:Uncharacterized protein n=1 Tax=Lachnellula subtilissima TaxID=602034 RepID=A0A8H8RUF4_9HELO|nr:hypothetical protein LSUB1_G002377 [Lachnellula subtilissima]